MKPDIHPQYLETKVTCVCGNAFETRSTESEIHVELCSQCHPFYTGQQKIIDTAGKVERFNKRMGGKKDELVSKKSKRAQRSKERKEAAEKEA